MPKALTVEQKGDLIVSLLEQGVPPGPIAKALDFEEETIKGIVSDLHIAKFGTDELAEAMNYLIWVAFEECLHQIKYGSPATQQRFISMVLARSVGIAGKQTPEGFQKMRDALEEIRVEMNEPVIATGGSIYEPGEFVAMDGA
jgi:hypothetical protein